MDVSTALNYIRSLGSEIRPGAKFDLVYIERLLQALGNPETQFPSVHVAGTNGKGSTAAMIEACARQEGLRTALYTSPHLERVTERIRIGGTEIDDASFARATTLVREQIERLLADGGLPQPPSFFETLTAVAFVAIAASQAELAVVEVGMGGRLDATNVLSPLVAVITPVGLDHERFLGNSIREIAGEKAGIIKAGVPTVSAPQLPDAELVIRERCREVGSQLHLVSEPVAVPLAEAEPHDAGCYSFGWKYLDETVLLTPGLAGRHQVTNAATAATVCECLSHLGLRISASSLRHGIAHVHWPGRLERVSADPEVWLDGAHNPSAARALADFLDDYSRTHPRPIIVFGIMRDKAIAEVTEAIFPKAHSVIVTAPDHTRAAAPESVAEIASATLEETREQNIVGSDSGEFRPQVHVAPRLANALTLAQELAARQRPVFITGSLYLVGEARELVRRGALLRRAV